MRSRMLKKLDEMRRKKEHLIPLEKSKRVIYLEHRGKVNRYPVGAFIFAALGGFCFLYCISILLFMGYGTLFFLIWGAMAVIFGGLAVLLMHGEWLDKIPIWIKKTFVIGCAVGVLFFAIIEGMILSRFGAQAKAGADYMIILGAQWKESGPSYVLQKRLEAAIFYLEQNPETIVIVSGGQGSNEPISEAEGMKTYLLQAGISSERILMEDQSTNTYENLVFSGNLIDKKSDSVVLVTNNFHVFRAVKIAEKQGYSHIEGQSAASYPAMVPNNLLREFFGVVKDFLVGNL